MLRNSLLTLCFSPRKRLSAEWRKLRYSSTQSSSYRTLLQEARRELKVVEVVAEARNSPSRTGSPPVCRELLISWDLRGKACGSERRWMHLSLLVFPVQTLILQEFTGVPKVTPPPAARCVSGSPAGPFFSCSYTDPAISVVFRDATSVIALPQPPSSPTKFRVERANRARLRAKRSTSHCGGRGLDRHAVTSQTDHLLTLTCWLIWTQQQVCFIWLSTRTFQCNVLNMGLLLSVNSDKCIDIVNLSWSHHVLLLPSQTNSCSLCHVWCIFAP